MCQRGFIRISSQMLPVNPPCEECERGERDRAERERDEGGASGAREGREGREGRGGRDECACESKGHGRAPSWEREGFAPDGTSPGAFWEHPGVGRPPGRGEGPKHLTSTTLA